ncbi:MAG: phosphotransferase [Myxococcota bacterium]|jgi:hypothetical protein|nr:phosphotransferase [Myxococcota bacterium]
MEHSITTLAQQLSLQPIGSPESEGRAVRLEVKRGNEQRALLYLWPGGRARRVTRALTEELAGQLFAAPELLDSDVARGWTLHAHPEGIPLKSWMRAKDIDSLAEIDASSKRHLFESMGVLARKLHSLGSGGLFGEIPDAEDENPTAAEDTWHTFNGWVARALDRYSRSIDSDTQGGAWRGRIELKESLGDLRHELSAFHPRHPAVLTHGALGVEHMWVDEHCSEVVALTGFDMARFLPAEADVANILWLEDMIASDLAVSAFYKGYGAARTMDVQRRERFYRRLSAFEALLGERCGEPLAVSEEALVKLAGSSVAV